MEEREISKAVIKRLPRYYRYLGEILNNGIERISSGELSGKMQVTASQIRQDLNNFGGFGQQGYGYNVKYLYFDIRPELNGTSIRGIPVMMMDELEEFVKKEDIEIAVLTLPKSKVEEVADRLVKCGIRALWNFAHLDWDVPDDVVVENVHLVDSLMQLSYRISEDNSEE